MMAHRPQAQPVEGLGFEQYHARPANLLRRVHQTSSQLFVQKVADPDMTQPRFEALVAIIKYPGTDQITLARGLGIDRSTTTLILDGLAAKGWIDRTVHPKDRRKRLLNATGAGAVVFDAARSRAEAAEARLLEPLSQTRAAALIVAMAQVATAVPSPAPELAGMTDGAKNWAPRHIAFLARRCTQISHALMGDAGREFDLTPQQFGIMYALAVAPADEAGLSRMVRVDRSAVEKVLRRLKARGFLERREQVLRLTAAGEQAFHALRGPAEATDSVMLASLTLSQKTDFMGGLTDLVAHHNA